jgi:hypothetical protein
MPKISEAEARALLSRPLRCEGDIAWTLQKDKPSGKMLSGGVVDDAGRGTHMAFDLKYMSGGTKTKYVFSVFMLGRSSTERVYQLEVIQARHEVKDEHAISHEHIGDRRLIAPPDWQHWRYDEVLAYFCAQTNISFTPVPPCP